MCGSARMTFKVTVWCYHHQCKFSSSDIKGDVKLVSCEKLSGRKSLVHFFSIKPTKIKFWFKFTSEVFWTLQNGEFYWQIVYDRCRHNIRNCMDQFITLTRLATKSVTKIPSRWVNKYVPLSRYNENESGLNS